MPVDLAMLWRARRRPEPPKDHDDVELIDNPSTLWQS